MSAQSPPPGSPPLRLLVVAECPRDAAAKFAGSAESADYVGDVYAAMGLLARSPGKYARVVVDSSGLDATERRFLMLAPRYFPDASVYELSEYARHNGQAHSTAPIAGPALHDEAGVIEPIVVPHFGEAHDIGIEESIPARWEPVFAAEPGFEKVRDPFLDFPSRDREGAVRAMREHIEPLPHGRGSEMQSAAQTYSTEPREEGADIESALAGEPTDAGDAAAQVESTEAETDAPPALSMHDAVRLRMWAGVAGERAAPRTRMPPGTRRETIEPPQPAGEGRAALSREELDALLGDEPGRVQGGAA